MRAVQWGEIFPAEKEWKEVEGVEKLRFAHEKNKDPLISSIFIAQFVKLVGKIFNFIKKFKEKAL